MEFYSGEPDNLAASVTDYCTGVLTPIALVTALRETSIGFALLIGVFFMNEKLNLAKVISTMMTLLGAALLRFSRST